LSVSGEKIKKPSETEEKEKSNQFILCKFVQRSYFEEKVLFLFSYIGVSSIIHLRYPLRFVIHLVNKENSAMLILGISKRTCGVIH